MNNKQEGKIVRIISNLCTVKVDDKLNIKLLDGEIETIVKGVK